MEQSANLGYKGLTGLLKERKFFLMKHALSGLQLFDSGNLHSVKTSGQE